MPWEPADTGPAQALAPAMSVGSSPIPGALEEHLLPGIPVGWVQQLPPHHHIPWAQRSHPSVSRPLESEHVVLLPAP